MASTVTCIPWPNWELRLLLRMVKRAKPMARKPSNPHECPNSIYSL
jgi:hypothetical protein